MDRFPMLHDNKEWKKIYLDSLGNTVGNLTFDNGGLFMGGLAVVQNKVGEDMHSAVINAQGKFIIPYANHYIRNEANGFVTVSDTISTYLYNKEGKLLFKCAACAFTFHNDVHLISCQPQPYYEGDPDKLFKGVVVMDEKGKEVFRKPGNVITRLVNIPVTYHRDQRTELLPYFRITVPRVNYRDVTDIVKLNGDLIMDSLSDFRSSELQFIEETLYVQRAGKSAILERNFKAILGFDRGYEQLYQFQYYPVKDVYSAGKKGKYGVITIKDEIIVPINYTYPLQYGSMDSTLFMSNPAQDSTWTFTMSGDTLETSAFRLTGYKKSKSTFAVFTDPRSGKYGYMHRQTKKFILSPDYDYLAEAGKDSLMFFRKDTAGYLNTQGKRIFSFPAPCYGVSGFVNDRSLCLLALLDGKVANAAVRKTETNQDNFKVKYVWVNKAGHIINNAAFDWFARFEKGKALVNNDGRYFFVDSALKVVKFQGKYDYQSYTRKGYAIIGEGAKKFGLIDSNGKVVLPIQYEAIDMEIELTPAQQYRGIQDGIPYTDPQGNKGVTNGFFYVPNIVEGGIKVTKDGNEEEVILFGSRKPGSLNTKENEIHDSIVNFYYYDHELLMEDLSREHIPLDGKEVSMIPYRQDELYGFVSKRNGDWIVKPGFDGVFAVYKEGAIVKTGEAYGFVDTTGKLLYTGYSNLFKEGNLYHGMFVAIGDSSLPEAYRQYIHNDYFSEKGKLLFTQKAHVQSTFQNNDSLAYFRYGKMITVRGRSGKIWMKSRVSVVKTFTGIYNNLLVYRSVLDGRVHYSAYTASNKPVFSIPLNFDAIAGPTQISANLFGFMAQGGIYFSDAKGTIKPYGLSEIPNRNDWNDYFKSKQFSVEHFRMKKYGVIDNTGKILVPFTYKYLQDYTNNMALFMDSTGNKGLVGRDGKIKMYVNDESLKASEMLGKPLGFYEGLSLYEEKCLLKQVDEKGSEYFYTDEDSSCYRYVDSSGKTVLDLKSKYRVAGQFRDGLAPVLDQKGNFGFIDKSGKEVISPEFEAMMAGGYPIAYLVVPEFINGYAYIKSYKGYIDKSGKKYYGGKRMQDHYNFSH